MRSSLTYCCFSLSGYATENQHGGWTKPQLRVRSYGGSLLQISSKVSKDPKFKPIIRVLTSPKGLSRHSTKFAPFVTLHMEMAQNIPILLWLLVLHWTSLRATDCQGYLVPVFLLHLFCNGINPISEQELIGTSEKFFYINMVCYNREVVLEKLITLCNQFPKQFKF